jgi:DNA-binding LacI/PurR family transcriptional regulator
VRNRRPDDVRRPRKREKVIPKYSQIAAEVWRGIQDSPPGTRCPGVSQIGHQFKIGHATAERVLEHLRQQGLVRVVPGSGTYVAQRCMKRLAVLSCHIDSSRPEGDVGDHARRKSLATVVAEQLQCGGHEVQVFAREDGQHPDLARVCQTCPDMLIAVGITDKGYIARLVACNKPVLTVGFTPLVPSVDFVFVSTVRSGYMAAQALLKGGLTDTWYVGVSCGAGDVSVAALTHKCGFHIACLEAGIVEPARRIRMVSALQEVPHAVEDLLGAQVRPRAILASSGHVAQMVLDAARRRDIRVPKDLAVFAMSGERSRSVTCFMIHDADVASATANLAWLRLQRPDLPPQDMFVHPRLKDAGTVPPSVAAAIRSMLPSESPPCAVPRMAGQ